MVKIVVIEEWAFVHLGFVDGLLTLVEMAWISRGSSQPVQRFPQFPSPLTREALYDAPAKHTDKIAMDNFGG